MLCSTTIKSTHYAPLVTNTGLVDAVNLVNIDPDSSLSVPHEPIIWRIDAQRLPGYHIIKWQPILLGDSLAGADAGYISTAQCTRLVPHVATTADHEVRGPYADDDERECGGGAEWILPGFMQLAGTPSYRLSELLIFMGGVLCLH
ncbi:uncharacterized protein BP01DRAFT_364161 [Aspergillus saccharolyticus JOP 1030-1]|uniref:Uncharacterized protein n=1 Tax=Aspergillus saccharolyticus JOP 1030-1 TaxID=1450539 RepID=A0A318ZS14_9EURO|nr:hypothetical protein BP01DRAFT_364161 [Aspergillus saccharolyticus JOP 1030-1]PYH47153.1 hypothetical protein BP01DRAFT_364161 [Aspergillus saccharolyticus JOP 1030-1]